MTTSVLERSVIDAGHDRTTTDPVVRPTLRRPPTLRGRESPWEVVEAGHNLARRAIGYALENVDRDRAVAVILEEVDSEDVLRLAWDYLAYTPFDVPVSEQVMALFLIEDAQREYHERAARSRTWFGRLRQRVDQWLENLGRWYGPYGPPDPTGGMMFPAW